MQKKPRTLGLAKYKFKPVNLATVEVFRDKVKNLDLSKKIITAVVKGMTYEDIADLHCISVDEAFRLSQEAIKRWAGPLSHTARDARELDLKRMDKMLLVLHPEVFPESFIDAETGQTVLPKPNPMYMKLYLDILARRANLLGLDAAKKLEVVDSETGVRREYIGVNPDDL